jgi:hypothetical protein
MKVNLFPAYLPILKIQTHKIFKQFLRLGSSTFVGDGLTSAILERFTLALEEEMLSPRKMALGTV